MPTAEYKMYASDSGFIATLEEAMDDNDVSQSEYIRDAVKARLEREGYCGNDTEANA